MKSIVLVVIVSCAMIACDSSSNSNNHLSVEDYVPLEVGYWYSQRVSADFHVAGIQGVNYPSTKYQNFEYTSIVQSSRYGELYEITGTVEHTGESFVYYKRVEDGKCLVQNGINDQVVSIDLQEPLEVGYTWITQSRSGNHVSITKKIVALNERVVVPAGTFLCIHILTESYSDDIYRGNYSEEGYGNYNMDGPENIVKHSWYAPDVGWVKTEITYRSTNEHPYIYEFTYELADYCK